MTPAPPPWLAHAFAELAALTAHAPNALLLLDAQRDNAHALASSYLANLLCFSPQQGRACGQCQSCHLLTRSLHPDYFAYHDKLKIEDIRHLNAQIATTPAISPRRAIYLGNIDQYDDAALNALLKTLEEPQAHSHFCLSAPNRLAVKPTIASRARPWRVTQPTAEQAVDWLTHAHHMERAHAATLVSRHHGDPYAALREREALPWALEALTQLLRTPHTHNAFLLTLESIPADKAVDWTSEQVAALIHQRQLDNPSENWQTPAHTDADKELLRLHRLYAALSRLRHPAQRQSAPVLAVKALLLETLDPRNPLL